MEIFKSVVKNESFWKELIADTNEFKEAAIYSNVLCIDNEYDSIFKNFFQEYKINRELRESVKMRVHLQGVKNEYSLAQLRSNPPKDVDNLRDWGEHLFEGKPWCIVLDKVSGCIDEITFPIARWIEPLISLYPAGTMVVDISPYIGKYGYTPFGAHIDVPGISVLHLHLGPNKKEMTVWDAKEFRKLSGSEDHICHDFEPYLSKGKTYILQAGDLFHLPAGSQYHIGKADEFSIGLTIGLKVETPKNILNKAIKEHQKTSKGIESLNIVETYKLKKKSNAGFMKTPILKKASDSDLIGRKLRINQPFKLILKERDALQLDLYIRGRCLSIPDQLEVKKCIDLLNQGVEVELKDSFFNDTGMERSKVISFMTKLYNYGGIILL